MNPPPQSEHTVALRRWRAHRSLSSIALVVACFAVSCASAVRGDSALADRIGDALPEALPVMDAHESGFDAGGDVPTMDRDNDVSPSDTTDVARADAVDAVDAWSDARDADDAQSTDALGDRPIGAGECDVGIAPSWECMLRYRTVEDPFPSFVCCSGRCVAATSCVPGSTAGARCGTDLGECSFDAGSFCCFLEGTPRGYACRPVRTGMCSRSGP